MPAASVSVTSRNGATAVIKAGPDLDVIGVNVLDGEFTASCAPVGRDMIMRSGKALYCISEK